jgi:hypothetical protein
MFWVITKDAIGQRDVDFPPARPDDAAERRTGRLGAGTGGVRARAEIARDLDAGGWTGDRRDITAAERQHRAPG